LQTACSTPVKDGMVVHTQTERVLQAQQAVVEFLLINHPLDCPVCDKGGECPLQDISMGWGGGRSRFVEPKRHFQKPLALSPLVHIDRERCILCYRCVRFSQEIAEDYQLVFLERADHTYVGTHDGRPYVGPFSGNIIELCPVGALTSTAYRFRARPWDVENSGSICTFCPSQCNVHYTIRDDEKVLRALARENPEVDDGWLCDKGRFGYQSFHSPERLRAPMVREAGALREVSWERALSEAASALERGGARSAALAGGATSNEEGYLLQHLMREGLGSPHMDSRPGGGLDREQARVLSRPELSARTSDIEYAGAVLVVEADPVDDAPIIDLRVRKAARRNGTRVVTLTSRPGGLDANASAKVRFSPGAVEAALVALAAELGSPRASDAASGDSDSPKEDGTEGGLAARAKEAVATVAEKVGVQAFGGSSPAGGLDSPALAERAGADLEAIRAAAEVMRDAEDIVVLWGERVSHGERGTQAVDALLAVAGALGVAEREESGLIEIPAGTNSRGLREVGVLPGLGPGLEDAPQSGMGAAQIARALGGGELSTLLLLHVDPLESHPERPVWKQALAAAGEVIAFTDFLSPGLQEHATVVFPAETGAEKEGTMTHPDGRLQRIRQAVGHSGGVHADWSVLAELCARAGAGLELPTAATVTTRLTDAVAFYGGATLEEIGGRGVRWQDRGAAAGLPAAEIPSGPLEAPPERADGLTLGTAATLWSGHVTRHAPSLRFLSPVQRAELSPSDAERLGVSSGDQVEVSAGGERVRASVALRQAVRPGSVFLVAGTEEENATALMNGAPRTVEVTKV
ncbi:MAG TPA: molybdopterin-dependent oxidoreductase, partial [Thermoleophilaceae bacterium]|nr:molybdopterin-dependent oxidoreductase [Thermoleophilaceae bacterium]